MKVMFLCRGQEQLGVEYLSACLKNRGHSTDLALDPGFDDTFFFRLPFLRPLNRWPKLARQVEDARPDILAVSTVSNAYPYVRELVRRVREAHCCYSVIGGVHASAAPDLLLKEGLFDAVCVGEGEEALVELADRLQAGDEPSSTKNFCFMRDGQVVRNPLRPLKKDLDTLPIPDKDLFFERVGVSASLVVLSGRGCPFSCAFCVNHQWNRMYHSLGPYVRRYSPGRMIEELLYFIRRHEIRSVNFRDDVFVSDRRWLAEFAGSYRSKIGRPFHCNVHASFVREDEVRLLAESGCASVAMGVQTADENKRRQLLGRSESNDEIAAAVALFRRWKIPVSLEYIFGLPGETTADVAANLGWNRSLRPRDTATYVFYPFPGTPLLAYCEESGILSAESRARVYRGEGSYHDRSLLDLPDRLLSETAARLFSILWRVPPGLGLFLIRFFARRSLQWAASLIYVLSLPIQNSYLFRERAGNYARAWWHGPGRGQARSR